MVKDKEEDDGRRRAKRKFNAGKRCSRERASGGPVGESAAPLLDIGLDLNVTLTIAFIHTRRRRSRFFFVTSSNDAGHSAH
jgi:hypothetical protein